MRSQLLRVWFGLVWFFARSLDPQLNVDLDLSCHDELDHVVNILSNGPRS